MLFMGRVGGACVAPPTPLPRTARWAAGRFMAELEAAMAVAAQCNHCKYNNAPRDWLGQDRINEYSDGAARIRQRRRQRSNATKDEAAGDGRTYLDHFRERKRAIPRVAATRPQHTHPLNPSPKEPPPTNTTHAVCEWKFVNPQSVWPNRS